MDISQAITSIIASVLGIFLAGQIVVWQHARADRQSAAGRAITLPASIRRTGTARSRLWRQGTVTIHDGRVSWAPNTPWGRAVALGGVGYAHRRHPAGPMRWLLPSAAVIVSCSDDQVAYEMAVLPVAVKHLFHAEFAR
jgi:hypothetical protein